MSDWHEPTTLIDKQLTPFDALTVKMMENATNDMFNELKRIPLDDLKNTQVAPLYHKLFQAMIGVHILMGGE